MPNQTIAITLSWGPVATDVRAADINELGTLIAQQLSAAMRADITFVPIVANDPATFDGQLIFNIPQNLFKSWDTGAGAYRAVTDAVVGDVKNSFVGSDSVATGWLVLNGRLLSDLVGLTTTQLDNLKGLFGTAADTRLPNVSPANVNGLPVGNAFGAIPWPTILPPAGTFDGLTFTAPNPTDAEVKTFAGDTELLETSLDGVFTLVKTIQAVCQQQLNAMNNAGAPPLYALVFCGYP